MEIKQLVFTRESIFDYALRSDVYIVSIPRPFGLASKSIKNLSIGEIIEAMENKELALVEVTGCDL